MTHLYSFGLGIGTQNNQQQWLEVFYSKPVLSPSEALVSTVKHSLTLKDGNSATSVSPSQMTELAQALAAAGEDEQSALAITLATSHQPLVVTLLATDAAPSSVPEGYLKLHLLSHRLVKPHGTNLTGLFGVLPNVAWTNKGAIDLAELPQRQLEARLNGELLTVDCVDKFPKMTNYVVPTGVRIAHTARVRLGAHIGEGTTIMHEGFVNFNAGTLGTSMVEGRISAGVVVGEGSDLGGGSSTMGTLSGGGNIVISVGKESLLGANSGIGIPLGDRCTVESGLYITAGTKVNLLNDAGELVNVIKARDLSGKADLLFRRNSLTGAIECLTNKSSVALNEELHANN
jgi:2,3,4,5-tetrahydropyridine-2,6-dicarboxylate N-succinyltransferase